MDYLKKKTIDKELYIPIHAIKNKEKYIYNKIKNLENTCLTDYGYIVNIIKIKNIKYLYVNKSTFKSKIIYKVTFEANVYNLQIGDIIKVNIILHDDSIYIGQNKQIMAIIHTDNTYKKGDEVEVEIQAYKYDTIKHIIKVISKTL